MVTPGLLAVDPESMADAGRDLAGVAQRIADDTAALAAEVAVSGLGDGLLGAVYSVVLAKALDAFDSYAEQVGFAAANLVVQARAIAETDEANAAGLSGAALGASAAGAAGLYGTGT
ncbi:hypothetical protein [Actinoplanes sp. NPDC051851]|uniref:hypothetical protein n=1 Tax=Actinoplanes sp. NPDC051851 TaxID=3154753 RepID=UPI0034488EDE